MWVVIALISLMIIITLLFRLHPVQNYAARKVVNYLQTKTGTDIRLDKVAITLPDAAMLEGLYLETPKGDTLIYTKRLEADIDLYGLVRNKIHINRVSLEGFTAHVSRTLPDSSFNFDFFLDSLSGNKKTTSPERDTASQAPRISVDEVNLSDIYATFYDEVGGIDAGIDLGTLNIHTREISLRQEKLLVDHIEFSDSKGHLRIMKSTPDSNSDTSSFSYHLGINSVDFSQLDFRFVNDPDSTEMALNLGELSLKTQTFDYQKQHLDLDHIELSDTRFSLSHTEAPGQSTENESSANASSNDQKGWTVISEEIGLVNLDFSMHNRYYPDTASGFDPNHLVINSLNSGIENLYFNNDSISGKIEKLNFSEHNGFRLRELDTDFTYTGKKTELNDLRLQTSNSVIRDHIQLSYSSISELTRNPGSTYVKINLANSRISHHDISYFQPGLLENMPVNMAAISPVRLTAQLEGQVDQLKFPAIETSIGKSTLLKLHGSATGLPDIQNSVFDVKLDTLTTTSNEIFAILPDTMAPSGLNIPDTLSLNGDFQGSLKDFKSNARFVTSLGSISASLTMKDDTLAKPAYSGEIDLIEMQLGSLLEQPQNFGTLSMRMNINGQGLDPRQMNANIDAIIDSAHVNQYTYKDVDISGNFENYRFEGQIGIEDTNIVMNMNGVYEHDSINPKYKLDLGVEAVDLQAINLSERDIRIKGDLKADFTGNSLKNLNGELAIFNTLIVHQNELYPIDSLFVVSVNEHEKSVLSIDSEFLKADFDGNVAVEAVPATLQYHIAQYFTAKSAQQPELPSKSFNFEIKLIASSLVEDIFLPGLNTLETGVVKGNYNSDKSELKIRMDVPYINYKGNVIDDLQLVMQSGSNTFNAGLAIKTLQSGPVSLNNLGFSSTIAHDSLRLTYTIRNKDKDIYYLLGANFVTKDSGVVISMVPGKVVLDSTEWNVPANNFIAFKESYIQAKNMKITNAGRKIALSTNATDSTLRLSFNDFTLSSLTNMLNTEYEKTAIGGVLSGNLTISQKLQEGLTESKLQIDTLNIVGEELGTLKLNATKKTRDIYALDLSLKGNNNDMEVGGRYQLADTSNIDLEVNIQRLNLAAIRPFTYQYLSEPEGHLSGDISINGKSTSPELEGSITFNNAQFEADMLGNRFALPNETIRFSNREINFNSFSIQDKRNNSLTIDGSIKHRDFKNIEFGLDLDAGNFMLMNSTVRQSEIMYGKLVIDANTSFSGTPGNPTVDGTISLLDETDMKYVIPQTEPASVSEEGIVEFVDKDRELNPILRIEDTDTTTMAVSGIDLSANIEIMPQASFRIIIDEQSGDYLTVQGNANLSLTLSPAGGTSLTGRYDINQGHYKAALFGLTSKKFNILDGSYLYWTGDPTDARMNIIAEYRVKTSPLNLVADQVENLSSSMRNQYKQKLPFLVQMNISGTLEQPDISFALQIPADQRNAMNGVPYQKVRQLNQPGNQSALNKQVLSLLAFNTFMPENPLDMEGGGGISESARTSVSRVLSRQLDQLANRYIKGVQLDIDVKSYEEYTAGGEAKGRTELDVGLQKNLFNDRVIVKVGSSFELEGQERRQEQGFKDIAGDISVAYKITPDGRLRIKAFSYDEYEQFSGDITESGIAFILIRDFNRIKKLFGILPEEEEPENEQTEKENEK